MFKFESMSINFNFDTGNSFADVFFEQNQEGLSEKDRKANRIIRQNMVWSMGLGFIPFPILDLIGVTVVQIDMVKAICSLYDVKYTDIKGKAIISALGGASAARFGASLVKGIPVIGTFFGGVSMSALSGASTFAVGRVFVQYLKEGIPLEDIDIKKAKIIYEDEFKKSKSAAEDIQSKVNKEIFQKIEQLNTLHEKGLITKEEFEAKKKELLDRM